MKRWLIVVSLLVAGLLMVGWAGDALAARHSPSLLQKILSALTPRPAPQHYVGANKPVETRRTESPPAKHALTAQPVPSPRPAEAPQPPGVVAPDPIAEMIDKTRSAPEAQPDLGSKSLQKTTQARKKAKPAQATQPVQAAAQHEPVD